MMRATCMVGCTLLAAAWMSLADCPAAASPIVRAALPAATAVAFDQHPGAQLPLASAFVDETGATRTLGSLLDARPAIVMLGYDACPNLCSTVRASLAHALGQVALRPGRDYAVLAVSIDPAEPTALAAATRTRTLDEAGFAGSVAGWHFLTGSPTAIASVARAVGFRYTYDDATRQYMHAAGIVVVTPRGRVSRYFLGVDYPPRALAASLVAAGRDAVAPPVPPLLLRCFHYDPATGRYSLAVADGARVLGLVTLAALTLAALWAARARRRTSRQGAM